MDLFDIWMATFGRLIDFLEELEGMLADYVYRKKRGN